MGKFLDANNKIIDLVYDKYTEEYKKILSPESRVNNAGGRINNVAKIMTNMLADPEVRADILQKKDASLLEFASKMGEENLSDAAIAKLRALRARIDIAARQKMTGMSFLPEAEGAVFGHKLDDVKKYMEEFIREGKLEEPLKEIMAQAGTQSVAEPTPAMKRSPQTKAIGQVLDKWLNVEAYEKHYDEYHQSGQDGADQNHPFHAQALVISMQGFATTSFDVSLMPRDDFRKFFSDDKENGQARLDAIKEKALAAAEKNPDKPYWAAINELAKYENPEDGYALSKNIAKRNKALAALEAQTKTVLEKTSMRTIDNGSKLAALSPDLEQFIRKNQGTYNNPTQHMDAQAPATQNVGGKRAIV